MKTILIVDDMPIICELLNAALARAGFTTLIADGGTAALDLLVRRTPDLVVLDMVMPRVDGLAVLRTMRATPSLRNIPVLVLTSTADRDRVTAAARLGISGYVLKDGFGHEEFVARVRAILGAPATGPAQPAPRTPAISAAPAPTPPAPPPAPAPAATSGTPEPISTREQLFEHVDRCGELQGLSPALAQVVKLTANASVTADMLAKAIAQDQAMVVKILKLANSSVYTRGAPVDSIQKAVVRIGLDRIRQAVLNISVVERFSSVAFSDRLDTRQFWEHSIACGIIAAEIAHALDAKHADAAYAGGLMHDVGRVVLADQLKDEYVRVIDAAREARIPLELAEARLLGATHADVMERILARWGFPRGMVKPVVLHHSSVGIIRSTAPEQIADAAALSLANRLAHALLIGTSGNDVIYPTEELAQAVRATPALIRRIEEVAQQQTDDVKFAMLSNAPSAGVWPSRSAQLTALLAQPLRALCVSAAPELDAVRIFTSRLAPAADDSPPNLGVLHVADAAHATRLLEQLKALERERGVENLPTLAITPPGRAHPYAADASRAWRHLTIPFAVTGFIDAANDLLARTPAAKAA